MKNHFPYHDDLTSLRLSLEELVSNIRMSGSEYSEESERRIEALLNLPDCAFARNLEKEEEDENDRYFDISYSYGENMETDRGSAYGQITFDWKGLHQGYTMYIQLYFSIRKYKAYERNPEINIEPAYIRISYYNDRIKDIRVSRY